MAVIDRINENKALINDLTVALTYFSLIRPSDKVFSKFGETIPGLLTLPSTRFISAQRNMLQAIRRNERVPPSYRDELKGLKNGDRLLASLNGVKLQSDGISRLTEGEIVKHTMMLAKMFIEQVSDPASLKSKVMPLLFSEMFYPDSGIANERECAAYDDFRSFYLDVLRD
jgi:hypothetical protein